MGTFPYPWLAHTGVNAGSKVNLNGVTTTVGMNNFIVVPQEPSKDPAGTWTARLPEVEYLGHGAPAYKFEGFIPSGLKVDADGSVIISFNLLGSFAKLGSPIYFRDPELILNPAGSAYVVVKDFKLQKPVSTGRRYTLELIESKEW